MYYFIKPRFPKLTVLTLIPLFAAFLLAINVTNVWATDLSKELTNVSPRRNAQTSPGLAPNHSTSENPSREIKLTPEEARIFKLINQERAEAGLPQLEIDSVLTELAREKSWDMVSHNYFGHYSEQLGTIHDQLKLKTVPYCKAAENLAGGPNLAKTFRRLLASPAHRSNILNPNFKRIGIGIAKGSAYGKMMTQVFID